MSGADFIPEAVRPGWRATAGRVAAVLGTAALILGGCAARPPLAELPPTPEWETRKAVLSSVDVWQFSGRIGVRTADDGFNASIRWLQQDGRFEATLSGPLGFGTVRLDGRGDVVTLTDGEGEKTVLPDAERDLLYRYGWTIPVQSLRFWALGIPDPGGPSDVVLDDAARLATLRQGGWETTVDRYRDYGESSLPARITASDGVTRVRLVIDRWSIFDQ